MGIPPALSLLAPLAPGNRQFQAMKDEKIVFLQRNNAINHHSVKCLFRQIEAGLASPPARQARFRKT
jgi:hypothetical protein